MDTAKRAVSVLTDAELRLRELVASAVADGEYEATQRIADWARTLGTLAREAEQTFSTVLVGENVATASLKDRTGDSPNRRANGGPASRRRSPADLRSKRGPLKGEYPKFVRRGDQLVKIAWSRKEREEYEHRAPRRVIDALTTAITQQVRNGKLFTVDELLPLKNQDDDSEFPSYQAYVVLAWFKLAGLVEQHGRRGYSVRNGSRLADAVVALWRQLSEAGL